MTLGTLDWENNLLLMAHEAQDSYRDDQIDLINDNLCLDEAYEYCRKVTYENSRTFYVASGLLPEKKKRAVWALYAFCRVCDDLVDRSHGENPERELEAWRQSTIRAKPTGEDCVALAWADTSHNFQIPWRYAEQLLHGVAMDFSEVCYETFDDLTKYCYGVACTVGLMSMHIIGYKDEDAIPYAIRMGVALQLTNVLRDIGEDYRSGRIYLPRKEMEGFNLSEQSISKGIVTPAWRDFMRFQIERTRRLYSGSMPGIALLEQEGRFAITAAAELYQGILKKIEANDYDVFNHRAALSKWDKLRRLPGIWWRSRTTRHPIRNISPRN
jgi:phytoene synthase